MADDNEGFWSGVIGIAAFLFGLGILILSVRIAVGTAPFWILYVGWFVFIAILVVSVAIAASLTASWAFRKTVDEIASLQTRYPKQLAQVKKRTPTLVATALLVSEAIVIIADKSFEGKTVATLVVSFVMLLGFTLANELMVKPGRFPWVVGLVLWVLMVAFLPGAIMLDRGWGFPELGRHLWTLPMTTKLFFALAALVMVVLPILIARSDGAELPGGPKRAIEC